MRVSLPALALAGLLAAGGAPSVRADSCAAVCPNPSQVVACNDGRPVWGYREPGNVCRGGSFGYLESRDAADAEWLRLAKSHKRRCDAGEDCEQFEALDRAAVVCLACDPASRPPPVSSTSAAAANGKAPPCEEDEWLQTPAPGEPARCFVEFVGLPPQIALQGRCIKGDCRSGVGTLRWPSGESYMGDFRNGKRHGQGTLRWPDGRSYIGTWRDGQPGGLGTRIFANGRYKAGYFDRGRYLGVEVDDVEEFASREKTSGSANPPALTRSCEEACTRDSERRLGRIVDEYECCYARHAFCSQKAEVAQAACTTRACRQAAPQQQAECDLRYSCDSVQTEKIVRYRRSEAACVAGCSSQKLDEQGLSVSERGTLIDE